MVSSPEMGRLSTKDTPVNVKPLNAERLYLNAFSKYCKY